MLVAVQGCCHGSLDEIYATVAQQERSLSRPISLVLICGDFQSIRNPADLEALACPIKYRHMGSFHEYYSGMKTAPYLTIFIGGNHEASNYLWELYYGGWVAPNIYFMGFTGVVNVGGLRIGGVSGIYNPRHYSCGYFERTPFSEDTKRSIYHLREYEIIKLKQISKPLDIFLSHDWPKGIAHQGNVQALLKLKPFLRSEIDQDSLGSPPLQELLTKLKPRKWFSAHMHVRFTATVHHHQQQQQQQQDISTSTTTTTSTGYVDLAQLAPDKNNPNDMDSHVVDGGFATTEFLALDKCLPRRSFLEVVDFPEATGPAEIQLDEEWLCILKANHHTMSVTSARPLVTSQHHKPANNFRDYIRQRFTEHPAPSSLSASTGMIPIGAGTAAPNYTIPVSNFCVTAPTYNLNQEFTPEEMTAALQPFTNPQSVWLCEKLDIPFLLADPTDKPTPLTSSAYIPGGVGGVSGPRFQPYHQQPHSFQHRGRGGRGFGARGSFVGNRGRGRGRGRGWGSGYYRGGKFGFFGQNDASSHAIASNVNPEEIAIEDEEERSMAGNHEEIVLDDE